LRSDVTTRRQQSIRDMYGMNVNTDQNQGQASDMRSSQSLDSSITVHILLLATFITPCTALIGTSPTLDQ
jgi:hypothetical protein